MFSGTNSIDLKYQQRREWVFLILVGLFLGSLTMLNILGISRFIDLSSFVGIPDDSQIRFSLAIGVLPYPITFLCTDFISEIYGRKRANRVVWVGLILNIWVLTFLWLGGELNAPENLLPDGSLPLLMEDGVPKAPYGYSFYEIRMVTIRAANCSYLSLPQKENKRKEVVDTEQLKHNDKSIGRYSCSYFDYTLLCACFANE